MRKFAALTVALALSLGSGCATVETVQSGRVARSQADAEAKRLASALSLLQRGHSAGAARAFETISTGPAVPGVTDEALFRLALLTLKPTAERTASPQAIQLLKRLKKEYPASPWTVQAHQLMALINGAEEIRRQNRSLKSDNQRLGNEIKELNSNIERLNNLDLELEKKAR